MTRFFVSAFVLAVLLASVADAEQIPLPQEGITLSVDSLQQTSASQVTAVLTLTNPSKYADGVLTVVLPSNVQLLDPSRRWVCTPIVGGYLSCASRVTVLGQQRITLQVEVDSGFRSEDVAVTFEVPQANARVIQKFLLSRSTDANAWGTLPLFPFTLLFIAIGIILWMACFVSERSAIKGNVSSFFSTHFLFLSVLSNLVLSLGVMLLASPVFSTTSFFLFSIVFASGFILLNYTVKPHEAVQRPSLTPQEISAEQKRLKGLVSLAREKYARGEMDELTFRSVVGECELELLKLEDAALRGETSIPQRTIPVVDAPKPIERGDSPLPQTRPPIYTTPQDVQAFRQSIAPPWVHPIDAKNPGENLADSIAYAEKDAQKSEVSRPIEDQPPSIKLDSEDRSSSRLAEEKKPKEVTNRVKELLSSEEKKPPNASA